MSYNTWLHKVAGVIAKPLAETSVTPNHITTARLIVGIAAAAGMAKGSPDWLNIAAGLFVLSMILDRADGVLARITSKTSRWGHFYDLWSDAVCNALFFIGLGFGLRNGPHGADAVIYGVIAGAAVACVLGLVLKLENISGERAGEIGSFFGFDPDDTILLVPIAIWLGLAEEVLIAASVGAPLFALLFFIIFLYRWQRSKFHN